MDAQQWLNQLQAALARQNLPPFYVARLVAELSDHISDSLEDRMSTDAKDLRHFTSPLGSPTAVAAAAIGEFRKRRFSTRHPIWTFLVIPIVSLVLGWIAAVLVFVLGASAISWLSGGNVERLPQWLIASLPVLTGAFVLAPIALVAVLVCRVASRAAIGWKWPLAACVILALIGGTALFDVKMTGVDRGALHGTTFHAANNSAAPLPRGSMAFGFGVNTHPRPWQVVQFSVPLAICGLFVWRQHNQRRQHVLAG
jgi:hypothetical protein